MPSLGDMVVRIVGDNSELDKAIDKSKQKSDALLKSMDKLGKGISLLVTAPLIAAGVAAMKSAGQFQMYQASFETMLGDAAKAKKLIDNLQTLAAATPFTMTDLAQGAQTLLQYGIAAENLLPTIRSLGDVAQGNSERFNRLALAFGQTQSTGRLMGQDLLQMINSGFNPLKVIAQQTGQSMGELKAKMEKGAISAAMVADAFKVATSSGGQFFGGMEKASKTLPGLMSTLSDDVATLGRSFAMILMPAAMDTVKWLSGLAKSFTDLDTSTKTAILAGAGFVAVAGPILIIIPKIVTAVREMSTAFAVSGGTIGIVVAAVALLTAGIVKMIVESKRLKGEQQLIDDAIKGTLGSTTEYQAALDLVNRRHKEAQAIDTKDLALLSNTQREKRLIEMASEVGLWLEQSNAIKKNLAASEDAEKKKAKAEQDRMNAEMQAALKRSKLESEAAAELQKKEAQIKEVQKVLETAGKSEAEIIENEIAALKTYTDSQKKRMFTDEQIMEYMKATHKDFYDKEQSLIDQSVSDYLSYFNKVQKARADSMKTAEETEDQYYARRKAALIESGMDEIAAIERTENEIAEKKQSARDKDKIEVQKKKDLDLSIQRETGQGIVNIVNQMFSTIASMQSSQLKNDLAEFDAKTQAQIYALDQQGLAEEEYRKKRAQIETAAAKERAQIEYKSQHAAWQMTFWQAIAGAAMSIIQGYSQLGPIAGSIAAAVTGVVTGLQVAAIAAAEPKAPSLAQGGIALPRAGGQLVNVAEAGRAEAILPLDRLGDMLSQGSIGAGEAAITVRLIQEIDKRVILDAIFPATKNKTVLVYSGALVS